MDIKLIRKTEPKKTHEYELESYSEVYHIGKYKLIKHIATLTSGLRYINIDIEALKAESGYDFYLPSLFAYTDSENPHITIQTSSYGSLDTEFIKLYIDAYNHAMEVARVIEASDLLK